MKAVQDLPRPPMTSMQMPKFSRVAPCHPAPQFSSSDLKDLATMNSEQLKALAKMACPSPAEHGNETQLIKPSSPNQHPAAGKFSEETARTRVRSPAVNEMLAAVGTPKPAGDIPAVPFLGSSLTGSSVFNPEKLEALTTMNSRKLAALKKAATTSSSIQKLLSRLHRNPEPCHPSGPNQGGEGGNLCDFEEDDVVAEAMRFVVTSSGKQGKHSYLNNNTHCYSPGQENQITCKRAEKRDVYFNSKDDRAMNTECLQFSNMKDECLGNDFDERTYDNRDEGKLQNFRKKRRRVGKRKGEHEEGCSGCKKHKGRYHSGSGKNGTYRTPGQSFPDLVYDTAATESILEDNFHDDAGKILKQIIKSCRSKLSSGMIRKGKRDAVTTNDEQVHGSQAGVCCDIDSYEVDLLSQFLKFFRTWPDSSSSAQTLHSALANWGLRLPLRYEVENLAVLVRPLYTGALTMGSFFIVRGLGVCRKTLEHQCYDRAVTILRTRDIGEIQSLADCGKDSLLEEVHRQRREDPATFTALLYQQQEEEDTATQEEAEALYTHELEHQGFEPPGATCSLSTPQRASPHPVGHDHRDFTVPEIKHVSSTSQLPEHSRCEQGEMYTVGTPRGHDHGGFQPSGVLCTSSAPLAAEHGRLEHGEICTEAPAQVCCSCRHPQQDLGQALHISSNHDVHEQTTGQSSVETVSISHSDGRDVRNKPVQSHKAKNLNTSPCSGEINSECNNTGTEAVERTGNFRSSKPMAKIVAKVEPWESVQNTPSESFTKCTLCNEQNSHFVQRSQETIQISQKTIQRSQKTIQRPLKTVRQGKSKDGNLPSVTPKHSIHTTDRDQIPDLVNIQTSQSQDLQRRQVMNEPEHQSKRGSEAVQNLQSALQSTSKLREAPLARKIKLLFQEMERAELVESVDMIQYMDSLCVKAGIQVKALYQQNVTEKSPQLKKGHHQGKLVCQIFYDDIQMARGVGQTCPEAQDAAYAHLGKRLMVDSIDSIVQGCRLPPQPETLPGYVKVVFKSCEKAEA